MQGAGKRTQRLKLLVAFLEVPATTWWLTAAIMGPSVLFWPAGVLANRAFLYVNNLIKKKKKEKFGPEV